MNDEVVHRCRSGKRDCVARTPEGAAVTMKPDTLCPSCIGQIQDMLAELPHLAQALRSFLGGSVTAGMGGSKVHSTPTPQAPINLSALDMIDEIGDVVDRAGGYKVRIDNLVREPLMGFRVWGRGRPVMKDLDGVDRALQIRRTHGKAVGMTGLSKRVWQKRLMPCPACSLPTLGSWFGEGTVHCTNADCNHAMSRDEYDLQTIACSRKERKR